MGLKHQAAAARKWRSAARQIASRTSPHLPPILFLTDPERISDPIAVARALPAGSGVIFRHFGRPGHRKMAASLAATCARRRLVFLIAADPELALRTGADGVHWPERLLGQSGSWRGQFRLQTASTHSRKAVHRAAQAGMDAAIFSTVFASESTSAGAPVGAVRFRRLCLTAPLPVYALGGINARTVGRIAAAGGAASVSGLAG